MRGKSRRHAMLSLSDRKRPVEPKIPVIMIYDTCYMSYIDDRPPNLASMSVDGTWR